ncbi:MAG: hypothetical protein IPJ34_22955 [Myxococcales bacterium]|nr:hypothetical protein [Myxococcales bacterium]
MAAPLAVPKATIPSLTIPSVRAHFLVTTPSPFPSMDGPSLSGSLRGLAFGMSASEIKATFPLWEAFDYGGKSKPSPKAVHAGLLSGSVFGLGLHRVAITYPSLAAAKKSLTATWGSPRAHQGSLVWHDAESWVVATLEPSNGGAVLFLEPWVPLAETLRDGGELAWMDKHLLDAEVQQLAPVLVEALRSCLRTEGMLEGDLVDGRLGVYSTPTGGVARYVLQIIDPYEEALPLLKAKLVKVSSVGEETTFVNTSRSVTVRYRVDEHWTRISVSRFVEGK